MVRSAEVVVVCCQLTQSQSELQMIYSDHSKGRLRCRFTRRLARNSVLLQSDSHHLLVAKGPLTDNGRL